MHNLVSHNQLAGWKSKVEEVEEETSQESAINDYFQCLTECDDNAVMCRRICKEVLVQAQPIKYLSQDPTKGSFFMAYQMYQVNRP